MFGRRQPGLGQPHEQLRQHEQGERRVIDVAGAALRARVRVEHVTAVEPEEERLVREVALPRAIIMARFVNYIEGRNLEA